MDIQALAHLRSQASRGADQENELIAKLDAEMEAHENRSPSAEDESHLHSERLADLRFKQSAAADRLDWCKQVAQKALELIELLTAPRRTLGGKLTELPPNRTSAVENLIEEASLSGVGLRPIEIRDQLRNRFDIDLTLNHIYNILNRLNSRNAIRRDKAGTYFHSSRSAPTTGPVN